MDQPYRKGMFAMQSRDELAVMNVVHPTWQRNYY